MSTTGAWSAQSGDLELIVVQVDFQGGVLQLHLKAVNDGSDSVGLPLGGYFEAIDNFGATYTADVFGSDWSGSVPAHETITGTVNLTKSPPASAKTLDVSFTNIFRMGGGNITVRGVPIPR